MELTDADREAMWLEILECTRPATLGPGEVTARDLCDREEELTYEQARQRLKKAVSAGTMVNRRVLVNGHWCNAYRVKR